MAIKVKDAATAAAKFASRGAAAGPDYAQGVQNAGNAWQAATAAAADNYAAGVQAAIGAGRFQKGINGTSASKFQARASQVGAQRYPQGVRDAAPAWQTATAPFLQTIAGLSLPPRRPKGDPSNFARVEAIGTALRKQKVGG